MRDLTNIRKVDAISFLKALDNAKYTNKRIKINVHIFNLVEYLKMDTYLSIDGLSGYSIKKDGEIVSLFSTVKRRGNKLINDAIKNGGNKLNCFEGYLTNFYKKAGFVVYDTQSNWNGENCPKVAFMKLKLDK